MPDASPGGPRAGDAPGSLVRTLWRELASDHVATVSAGLAYYGVFGLLPALAAAAALWSRFGSLELLRQSADSGNALLPPSAMSTLEEFLTDVPAAFGTGWALLANLAVVSLTAARAARCLLTALSIVYDITERRGWLQRLIVALFLGWAGVAFLFTALLLLALPPLLARPAPQLGAILTWLRWPLLAVSFGLGLILLFRTVPRRTSAGWSGAAIGAAAATALWLVASVGVTAYVGNVGSFGRLYGPLSGFAVVLLWFYVGAFAVLAGAELDAVLTDRRARRRQREAGTEEGG